MTNIESGDVDTPYADMEDVSDYDIFSNAVTDLLALSSTKTFISAVFAGDEGVWQPAQKMVGDSRIAQGRVRMAEKLSADSRMYVLWRELPETKGRALVIFLLEPNLFVVQATFNMEFA